MSTAQGHEIPEQAADMVPRRGRDGFAHESSAAPRIWDLRPGDHFHGRTVTSVRGVVGLASSPVAVISFAGQDTEHRGRTRIGATHSDTTRGHDELRTLARAWVRDHGLGEGQAVDLTRLRTEVMAAIAPD